MTIFEKELITWLKETEAELLADGLIPTLKLAIEKALDQVEVEVDNSQFVDSEPADFTGSSPEDGQGR